MSSRSQRCCYLNITEYDEEDRVVKLVSYRLKRRYGWMLRHTVVEVFGQEFHYFDTGAVDYRKGESGYKDPVDVIVMGRTDILLPQLLDHVDDLCKDQYNKSGYNVVNNNCNHYSNELSKFLVDEEIPRKLKDQSIAVSKGVGGVALAGAGAGLGAIGGPVGVAVGAAVGATVGVAAGSSVASHTKFGASAGAAFGETMGARLSSDFFHSSGQRERSRCYCPPSCGCLCGDCDCSPYSNSYRKQK